jgi:hypothetical protein
MRFEEFKIVFPDGDKQDISHRLSINQMVNLNGYPIPLPLKTSKDLVYRVYKISTENTRNEIITNYHLEQVSIDELKYYLK